MMNNFAENQWTPRDELEWDAFRYVANELSDEDAAAFEQRLADDQQAREAVAHCVEMTHAVVALAEAEVAHVLAMDPAPAGWQRMWSMLAAAAAVIAVCSAFWIGTRYSNRNDDAPRLVKAPGSSQNGERDEIVGELILGWLDADTSADEVAAVAGQTALPGSSEPETPEDDGQFDWMVAGLDEAGEMMMDSGPNNEEPN